MLPRYYNSRLSAVRLSFKLSLVLYGTTHNHLLLGLYIFSDDQLFPPLDYLKNQMDNYISIKTNVVTTTWQSSVYRSVNMSGYPSDSINCLNECLNVDINVCTSFVFENLICYLGRVDFLTGTVSQFYSSVTLFTLIRELAILFAIFMKEKAKPWWLRG